MADTPDQSEEKTPIRRKAGSKKADEATCLREAELVAKWQQARDSSVYKADFAKDHNMSLKAFDGLLSRVKKRELRSDK